MSRSTQTFVPRDGTTVRFYNCGLTVYSQPHIGNWVGYIYWDLLTRVLGAEGYDVLRTQNITDVGHLVSDDDSGEDKLEKGAKREGTTAWDVARKYSDIADHEAYDVLRLIRPDNLVPATSLIEQQIEFAKVLDDKGYLYDIPGDGMYFDTAKISDYGKLARLDIDGLEAGKRVSVAGKRHITDFAVWKYSPANEKRDMEWGSPWGVGFPGWHLECSVIAYETLGPQLDIHAGGIDHIPVHHTNEITQSESFTGREFSKYWVHNNHLKIDGVKISKSLGNIYTLSDIIGRGYDIDAFKLFVYEKHYRTEGNFTWEILTAAQNRLNRWRSIAALRHQTHDTLQDDEEKSTDDKRVSLLAASQALQQALADDLDTPAALAIIDEAFGRLENRALSDIHQSSLEQLLTTIDELLGLQLIASTPDIDDTTKQLILARVRARENKDFAASDRLRDELAAQGIVVRDTASGPIWSYA